MFDATLFARERAIGKSGIVERLDLLDTNFNLCTVHRAESCDNEPLLKKMIAYLEQFDAPTPIVFPVHPRTRKALETYGIKPRNMVLIDPVGYFDIHRLLAGASIVFTDSGGLQKEAYFHRVPCVIMRNETEWVETISAGWNRLWSKESHATPRRNIDEYGTGNAAGKIVSLINDKLV